MAQLVHPVLKLSASTFRRELTCIDYLSSSLKFSVLRYLNNLLSKLNKEGKPRGIRRLLEVKKISDDISNYRQRVQTVKEDFLVGGLLST